jgi:hypothetical protein
MDIYDCISIAEKECLDSPCDDPAACDLAGECLRYRDPPEDFHLPNLLSGYFGMSTSEARRHMAQGAVFIDDVPVSDLDLPKSEVIGRVLRVGRRRFVTVGS